MAGGYVANVGGANPMIPVSNDYAKLNHDCTSLGGKPATEVENWTLHRERIFFDLGLNNEKKKRLASRQ